MKKAVIYARYSSDRQNEQSIDGQIEVCEKWAKENDVRIVGIYHDAALTGKTDKRPEFQRMIKDAKLFDYVLVYKLDRFARNRYDAAVYKAKLKAQGVKLISVMENISDTPEGIILESVLEGMAEYYSENLSQNVTRGMSQRAAKGKFLGGQVPLGYAIDADKNYIINEKTAPAVKIIFEKFVEGKTGKQIAEYLNAKGYTDNYGKPFRDRSFITVLRNERYTGVYIAMGERIEGLIPPLISKDLFASAQRRIETNRHAPAASKADVSYFLTGKLFCGKCGATFVGNSGRSKTGKVYHYYSCKKKNKGCNKKPVGKEWIENLVVDITLHDVLTDENIPKIAKEAFDLNEKERNDDSEVKRLKKELQKVTNDIEKMLDAIVSGAKVNDQFNARMEALDRKKQNIQLALDEAEIKIPPLKIEHIEFFLWRMRESLETHDEEEVEHVIRTFVNAVYLFDDKITITFNPSARNHSHTLNFDELKEFGFTQEKSTIITISKLLLWMITKKLR